MGARKPETRAQMVPGDWIKPGATVIDVGINRIDAPEKGEGKTRLVGDADYDSCAAVAGAITVSEETHAW